MNESNQSEKHKLFSDVTDDFVWDNFQDIEVNGLAEWSAFTNDDNISFLNGEGWRAVDWKISVSFFISIVFWNVVEIISSDDDGSLHFCGNTDTLEDLSSDWNVAGEWALFVNICGFNGFFRSSESESDVFKVSDTGGGLFSEKFFSI